MSAKNIIFLLLIVNDCIRMMQAVTKPPTTENYLGSDALPAGNPQLPSFPLSNAQIVSLGPIHPDVYQDTLLPAVSIAFLNFEQWPKKLMFRIFSPATFIIQTRIWDRGAPCSHNRWLYLGSTSDNR